MQADPQTHPANRRDRVVLMLAGDVMTGRGIDQVLAHPSAPRLLESHVRDARDYVWLAAKVNGPIPAPVSPEYIWGDALEAIDRAAPDLRIVNLETAITLSDDAWPAKGIHYRMNPANVACLKAARLDACVLANNHVLDWGRCGLLDTRHALQHAGLQCAGAGVDGGEAWAPAVLPIGAGGADGHVLLYAFATGCSGVPQSWAAGTRRPGVALLPDLAAGTAELVAEDVVRRRGPDDIVVISLHWGGNWGLDVPAAHREFAHRLIDLGAADVVHGHSSHHPMPFEVYRGRLILFGCGDLMNDYEGIAPHGALRSDVACLYFVSLALDGAKRGKPPRDAGRLLALDIVPLQLRRFRLTAADAAARASLEPVFNQGACRLGPARHAGLPASWSVDWQASP